VIAELIGVPAADRDQFREWSDAFVRPALTPEEQASFMQSMVEFVTYLQALFEARRSEPARTSSAPSSLSRTAATRCRRRSCRAWSRS